MLHRPQTDLGENFESDPLSLRQSRELFKQGIRNHVVQRIGSVRDGVRRNIPEISLENLEGIDDEYRNLKAKKDRALEVDVAKIQSFLSNGVRDSDLDTLAKERLRMLKKPGALFEHDPAWLAKKRCGENLHKGNFTKGSDIIEAFILSPAHLENVKGTYEKFGVAVDGDMCVILYQDGVPKKETSEESVLQEMEQVFAQKQESSASTDVLEPLWKKLQQKNEGSGLTLLRTKDGISFSKGAKNVTYLFQESPPRFVREEREEKDSEKKLKKLKAEEVIPDAKNILVGKSEEALVTTGSLIQ